MNDLKIYENKEFGEIRTAVVEDEPMFCLTDVCRALGITHITDVKSRLRKDGVGTSEVIDSLGRKQTAIFVNESNLYKVIFQSRKEAAERFTDWVTSEVLPSIRKNGGYIRSLGDADLAQIIMCPSEVGFDEIGFDEIVCQRGKQHCIECTRRWLEAEREVEE